jgi:hypothetical protein
LREVLAEEETALLDERVATLAGRTAAVQLKDLDGPLEMSAAANRAKLHGHGYLWLNLMDLYAKEVGRRAEVIWRNLHRAHSSFGAARTATLHADLVETFRANLYTMLADLRLKFDEHMKEAPLSSKSPTWVAQLEEACQRELRRYEAEVEHYVASLDAAVARGTPPASTYVIHGNVGALVTGAGAVTNIVQNIGASEREALSKALEMVRQVLATAPELAQQDRTELAEFVDEVETELSRERPNTRRLTVTLQSLAAAVQGIANGPGAYEALRAAAAAIGIPV